MEYIVTSISSGFSGLRRALRGKSETLRPAIMPAAVSTYRALKTPASGNLSAANPGEIECQELVYLLTYYYHYQVLRRYPISAAELQYFVMRTRQGEECGEFNHLDGYTTTHSPSGKICMGSRYGGFWIETAEFRRHNTNNAFQSSRPLLALIPYRTADSFGDTPRPETSANGKISIICKEPVSQMGGQVNLCHP